MSAFGRRIIPVRPDNPEADKLMSAARELGKFVAVGLLDFNEADSCIARRAVRITPGSERLVGLEHAAAAALNRAAADHEIEIASRIRRGIEPLIRCRACPAAIIAQARHVNNAKGRLNALPDADVQEIVRTEIKAAIARMKEARRA